MFCPVSLGVLEFAEFVRLEGLMILTLSYNNIRAFAETEMDTLGTVRFCLQGTIWEPPEQAVSRSSKCLETLSILGFKC